MSSSIWRGPKSGDDDGGNSLIAALEYWNGGMIYNDGRNKVGVVRWFSGGSRARTGGDRMKFGEFVSSFRYLLEKSPAEELGGDDRYVFFSDLHLGDGGRRDDLAPNPHISLRHE